MKVTKKDIEIADYLAKSSLFLKFLKDNHITQSEVMDESGIDRSRLSRWIRGYEKLSESDQRQLVRWLMMKTREFALDDC